MGDLSHWGNTLQMTPGLADLDLARAAQASDARHAYVDKVLSTVRTVEEGSGDDETSVKQDSKGKMMSLTAHDRHTSMPAITKISERIESLGRRNDRVISLALGVRFTCRT